MPQVKDDEKDRQMRQRAIELAVECKAWMRAKEIVDASQRFYEFLSGKEPCGKDVSR